MSGSHIHSFRTSPAEQSVVAVRQPAAGKPLRAVRVRVTRRADRIVTCFRRPSTDAGIGRLVTGVLGTGYKVVAIDRRTGATARERTLACNCNAARAARRALRVARACGLGRIVAHKSGWALRISRTDLVRPAHASLLRFANTFVIKVLYKTCIA